MIFNSRSLAKRGQRVERTAQRPSGEETGDGPFIGSKGNVIVHKGNVPNICSLDPYAADLKSPACG